MRRVLLTITILLLMAGCAWAQLSGVAPGMAFTEEDGSPDTTCFVAKFTNGSLTDNGDGTCSVSTSGGGGGTPGGSNTEIQYNNSSSFGGISTFKYTSATGTITNTGTLKSTTGYIVGSGADQNEDLIVVDRASSDAMFSWDETNDEFDITHSINVSGTITLNNGIKMDTGTIYIQEQAEADADIATYGQIWVDTQTPNVLYFTDDAGTDHDLLAGGGSGAFSDLWRS